MKHTVYTLLFGLIPFLLIAQEPACGTQGGELFAQQLLKDLDLLRQHEARFAGDPGVRTTTSASLPVQFHVVRTSGGGSSLTQGTLNQAVVILNNYFQYAGIQFFQCAAPIYIDDVPFTPCVARLVDRGGGARQRERELLAFKYGAELTNREIARVTKLSESNVGTILHRAVATLRSRW